MMEGFILHDKVYDFMLYFFPVIEKLPKYEKFTLQTQVKNSVYELLKLTIEIQKSKDKTSSLKLFDRNLEFLRILVRYMNEKKNPFISNHTREVVMVKVDEIGRITGGLIKRFG